MKRIAVLFHRNDSNPSLYVVHQFRRFWEEDGYEVIYLFGTRQYVPADLLLVHVNLSVVPEEYLAFAARYPISINGRLQDIRKTAISDNLIGPENSWDGPVIVKSNLNYFGTPERRLQRTWAEKKWPLLIRLHEGLKRRLRGKDLSNVLSNYKVFNHRGEIPSSWFAAKDIVIEKFRPEIENGLFHLRMAQILGDRVRCTRIAAQEPVIKANRSIHSEDIEPDPAVSEWRQRFHVDYGKMDYVVSGGQAILLDVNKTTGMTANYRDAKTLDSARRFLAEGIYSYFT